MTPMPKVNTYPPCPLTLLLPVVLAFLASPGCTRYDYELVSPPGAAQPVGRKAPARVELDPVVYELLAREDRLVMIVRNEADVPVKLAGEDSYVVDPEGESHPLPTRTIAPRATTKLIFPPMSAAPRPRGPVFGVGVGVGLSSAGPPEQGHFAAGARDDFGLAPAAPQYYSVEPDETAYWDWRGEGTIRMRLVYEQEDRRVTHDLVFERRKS